MRCYDKYYADISEDKWKLERSDLDDRLVNQVNSLINGSLLVITYHIGVVVRDPQNGTAGCFISEVIDVENQYVLKSCMHSYHINDATKKHNEIVSKCFREKIAKRKKEQKEKKCPLCGAKVATRTGKYGVFYGCTKWPNCRGLLDVNGCIPPKIKELKEQVKAKKEMEGKERVGRDIELD